MFVVNFTHTPELVTLYEAQGLANEEFRQMYALTTPSEEGVYVYKIDAQFEQGDILYYFAVEVKKDNIMQ